MTDAKRYRLVVAALARRGFTFDVAADKIKVKPGLLYEELPDGSISARPATDKPLSAVSPGLFAYLRERKDAVLDGMNDVQWEKIASAYRSAASGNIWCLHRNGVTLDRGTVTHEPAKTLLRAVQQARSIRLAYGDNWDKYCHNRPLALQGGDSALDKMTRIADWWYAPEVGNEIAA